MKISKKWITVIVLLLILVSSLSLSVFAAEPVVTTDDHSVTLTMTSQADGANEFSFELPAGYTFADITAIHGFLSVYEEDLTITNYPFSCLFSYASSATLYANVILEPFFDNDARFIVIYDETDFLTARFYYTHLNPDYDTAFVSSLTIEFGENVKTPGSFSAYQNIYDIIHHYIYGGVELTPEMSLTITQIATIASVFLAFLPFIVVYLFFFKRWR